MKTNELYNRPETTVIDLTTDNVLQNFAGFSEEENVDGPPVYPNPEDGVYPEDALSKGYSVWDE